jgi:site-specific recombinase XerD
LATIRPASKSRPARAQPRPSSRRSVAFSTGNGPNSSRSFGEVERHLLKHTKPLHGLQLAKVDKRSIATRLGEITHDSGPVAANRVRSSLSAFFAWCMREGLIDANPVINTNKAMENDARSRVLRAVHD